MAVEPIMLAVSPVAVLPTQTIVATVHTLRRNKLTVEFKNTDGSQTLDVTIYRRASLTGDYSPSNYGGLTGIPPGESRCADLDVSGSVDTQFRAQASGIGLTAQWAGVLQ